MTATTREIKVKQWQVYYDDINGKYVKVDSTEREQTYEENVFLELTKPQKQLNGKSALENAGYRYEIIKQGKQ